MLYLIELPTYINRPVCGRYVCDYWSNGLTENTSFESRVILGNEPFVGGFEIHLIDSGLHDFASVCKRIGTQIDAEKNGYHAFYSLGAGNGIRTRNGFD